MDKEMSLLKTSRKQIVAKDPNAIHNANGKTIIHTNAFDESKLIVLTINPDLDKVSAKPNAKAESAKQMFANHRNKK